MPSPTRSASSRQGACSSCEAPAGPASRDAYIKAYRDGVGPDTQEQAIDQWTWIQQFKAYNTEIVLSPDRMLYMQRLNVSLGTQKAVLPLDEVADMSIARDAAKLAAHGPY